MSGRLKDRLKRLVGPVMIPIRGGPLQGLQWNIATGSKFLKGTYEPFKTKALVAHLRPGDVVYDVGAHVGYYSATAALAVGAAGHVYSFEPRPGNYRLLERHMRVNKLENVTITCAGIGRRTGTARFESRTGTGTGHVSDSGDLDITIVALDEWTRREQAPAPHFVKIDVEGGEVDVIEGGRGTLESARPAMLVATHGDKEHEFVCRFLEQLDYSYEILDHEGHRSGDIEILALPPARSTAAT